METVKIILYVLAAATSVACALFLFLGYFQNRVRLLLWSALCFTGLAVNNIMLFVDVVIIPSTDLRAVRLLAALAGMLFLLYGFIWEAEE